ncbi:hypothetical protein I2486_04915 [Cellulophaga sp. E16_2]|uniref:Uncharacterized protein n=1 Tax=Cellulophaga algicola (strain DSM 14237 / IC166 / ACAM 630) TaxID=688270 RepID=E6X510_CELAD|nr:MULTISPECIES: hypothetical protein [Cellulophaga]ADV48321.1 hypothetical protein Celal_0996 [Cellulophaga algicola DSM 14237]MBO0590742.1 hypothetical protein [Cellulophaga sp. E16_2]
MRTFNLTESDTTILLKKDKAEIENWIENLEFINTELEYFTEIETKILKDNSINQLIQTLKRGNTLKLGILYRCESNMSKIRECDSMQCDTYYLNNHEKNRTSYLEHMKLCYQLKTKIYDNLLKFKVT